ncbi:MAG TPA: hypothetical protein VK654_10100 [Nitrospirota bacterium]|nr:hypothetical protein [Nitrospirota bacterium]
MNRMFRMIAVVVAAITAFLLLMPEAWAVPNYSRRYNIECSGCHTMWGALNGNGVTFRLSGYRAFNGNDLTPVEKDVDLGNGAVIPSTLPLSMITGVGFDYRRETRNASNGTTNTRTASSIGLEDASIFLTTPLGEHLSAFMEFPMYETKAWEFTPTGPGEANDTTGGRDLQFKSETPAFEVAKFFWNNLLGASAPRDSFNLLGGISHPPLAYSPGKVRLSVNQYPIYERRALDLISPKKVDDFLSADQADSLFRLSEPQTFVEVMGMIVPGQQVLGKKETFWMEYHLGVANGSNGKADNNSNKDMYGRFVVRWFNQTLGAFAYYSPDTYSDDIRTAGAAGGVMSGVQSANRMRRIGPDMTLSLAPFGIPVWLENQFMFNRESNPTGYGKEYKWSGGFHQLNWQISKKAIVYGRYDYINGNSFNDGHNPATKAEETDEVVGFQYLIKQTVKFAAEYRNHEFKDKESTPNIATLKDDGFTTRFMIGF